MIPQTTPNLEILNQLESNLSELDLSKPSDHSRHGGGSGQPPTPRDGGVGAAEGEGLHLNLGHGSKGGGDGAGPQLLLPGP